MSEEEQHGERGAVPLLGNHALQSRRLGARAGWNNGAPFRSSPSFAAAGLTGSPLLQMEWPLASASIRLETLVSARISSRLSSPPPWGQPLCKSRVKTTATLPQLSAIKLPRNVPYDTVLERES